MSKNKTNYPTKPFSFNTIDNFDSHIEKSIMGYNNLQELIINLSANFIRNNSKVVDLGCSTGRLIEDVSLRHKNKDTAFFGYDISNNLLPESRPNDRMYFIDEDITDSQFEVGTGVDLIYLIFTLQFLDARDRDMLLLKIYMSLNWGGALIIAEKVYCKSGKAQEFFTFANYDIKGLSFKAEEILKKQKDLRPIMNPQYEDDLIRSFTNAGFQFKNIELFWGSLQFKAWILIK